MCDVRVTGDDNTARPSVITSRNKFVMSVSDVTAGDRYQFRGGAGLTCKHNGNLLLAGCVKFLVTNKFINLYENNINFIENFQT